MTTYSRWQRTIVDGAGNVQAGATVTVYRETDGALATLKAARDGSSSKSNPFTVDSNGFAFFYAAAGRYRIVASSGAYSDEWRNVPLGTAQEVDFESLTGAVYYGAAPAGVRLNFSTTTTASDPGTGVWRANSATFASITALYIDNADPSGGDITGWLDALDDNGASGHRGILRLVSTDNILAWAEFIVTGSVTNSSGYRTLSVTPRAQVGWQFANGASCAASFAATGASGSMTGPGSSTDEAIARFDGTDGNILQNSSVLISDAGDLKAAGYLRVGSTSAPTNTTAGDLTAIRGFFGDTASNGYVRINAGNGSVAGWIGWYRPGGGRSAFIGSDAADLPLTLENSAKFIIAGGSNATSTTTGALVISGSGGLGVAGAAYFGAAVTSLATPGFINSGAAGTSRGLRFQTAASNRWGIFATSDSESGANAGSNFSLNSYDDSGSFIGTPLIITRSSGFFSFPYSGNVGGYLRVGSTSAPTNTTAGDLTVIRAFITGGVVVGSATGGDKGAGTINVAGDIYKNNTAYTSPDFVFEHFYTGKIERFAKNEGASSYRGLMGLDALRDYTRTHLRLPGIDDEGKGIFARSDTILEKFEELTLYTLDIHERASHLSAREKALTAEVSALKQCVQHLEGLTKH